MLEVDDDLFVVALARPGAVVTGMDDAPVIALQLLEPDRVQQLARGVEQQAGGVEVDVASSSPSEQSEKTPRLTHVPAEPHRHPPEAGVGDLIQSDRLALD